MPPFSGSKVEATCSSETSVDFERSTRCYIPEERIVHNHRCEKFKSDISENARYNVSQRAVLWRLLPLNYQTFLLVCVSRRIAGAYDICLQAIQTLK
jgi:hypothetical protein